MLILRPTESRETGSMSMARPMTQSHRCLAYVAADTFGFREGVEARIVGEVDVSVSMLRIRSKFFLSQWKRDTSRTGVKGVKHRNLDGSLSSQTP